MSGPTMTKENFLQDPSEVFKSINVGKEFKFHRIISVDRKNWRFNVLFTVRYGKSCCKKSRVRMF